MQVSQQHRPLWMRPEPVPNLLDAGVVFRAEFFQVQLVEHGMGFCLPGLGLPGLGEKLVDFIVQMVPCDSK